MADFRPFRGLLPSLSKDERIGERVAPPYDVISDEERRSLQSHPRNITRITLGKESKGYKAAALELEEWIQRGSIAEDENESFYIYRQTFTEDEVVVTRTGIVGRLRVEPYGGSILPHEETSSKVKEDRLNLLRAVQVHAESIFCIYEHSDSSVMRKIKSARPFFEHVDATGVKHSLSRIADPSLVKAIASMMLDQRLLIADGHHRYETALRYSLENPGDEKKAYVLATLISTDDPGLVVRPTHRLYEVGGFSTDFFLSTASKEFGLWEALSLEELEEFMRRSKRTALGLLMKDGRMFVGESLAPRQKDPLENLDTKICEDRIYSRMLVPMAEGRDVRMEYDHDLASVKDKIASGKWDLAVALSPPKLETIWSVAKLGEKMPRKSTYFWPKIWSGFVMYSMK